MGEAYQLNYDDPALVAKLGDLTLPDVLPLLPSPADRPMTYDQNAKYHTKRFVKQWFRDSDRHVFVEDDAALFVEEFGLAPEESVAQQLLKNTAERTAKFIGEGIRTHWTHYLAHPSGYVLRNTQAGHEQGYSLDSFYYAWE